MSVKPMLAKEWKRIDDLTWEFKLQDGAKFSNGEPFNADAVKFSIDYINQRSTEGKPLGMSTVAVPAAEITNVEPVDESTVRITTKAPKVLLPLYLAQIPMLEPKFYGTATDEEKAKQMIGTGPYVVAEHVRDSHVKLVPNPNYWGDKPKVEEVLFRIIPEKAVQIAELETGNVDIVPVLPFDQAQVLVGKPGVQVQTIRGWAALLDRYQDEGWQQGVGRQARTSGAQLWHRLGRH